MATLLVGYDLNKPGQNYDDLIEALKSNGDWWHCLDSTWLIRTSKTVVQVRDELVKLLDGGDELLVMDVTGVARAWAGFDAACSEWLQKN